MMVAAYNLHAANPAVAEALKNLDPRPLQEVARRCQLAGAKLLDLNPGYLSKRHEDRMAFMVEAIQEVSDLPLILDSPNPSVLQKGLLACRSRPILNALTLEKEKLEEILPLAAEYDTKLVLLLLDNHSFSPPTLDEKIALAAELRRHCLSTGLKDHRLILDPLLPNLRWPDGFRQVQSVIETVRWLADGSLFGDPVGTIVGLSNLRSGLRRQYPWQVEATCLAMLADAGLKYVLADVLQPEFPRQVALINQLLPPRAGVGFLSQTGT
jgi:5-methyltetrahydrofolate corrinoid/iron sulfur protein methyltransferase